MHLALPCTVSETCLCTRSARQARQASSDSHATCSRSSSSSMCRMCPNMKERQKDHALVVNWTHQGFDPVHNRRKPPYESPSRLPHCTQFSSLARNLRSSLLPRSKHHSVRTYFSATTTAHSLSHSLSLSLLHTRHFSAPPLLTIQLDSINPVTEQPSA